MTAVARLAFGADYQRYRWVLLRRCVRFRRGRLKSCIEAATPDVLLLDIHLPGMLGLMV